MAAVSFDATDTAPATRSLWNRDPSFRHSGVSLPAALVRAIEAVFENYESAVAEPSSDGDGSEDGRRSERVSSPHETSFSDASMSTDDEYRAPSRWRRAEPHRRLVNLARSESEESMSEGGVAVDDEGDRERESDDDASPFWESVKWDARGRCFGENKKRGRRTLGVRTSESAREPRGDRLTRLGNSGAGGRCIRCEAYDAHCKSAAENYRRTLNSYTKTVSELMVGFKTVLERYPELKVETGDERIYCMVQAAYGRNSLVESMVRLAAKRGLDRELSARDRADLAGERTSAAGERSAVVAVCDALRSHHADGEALRMILERYAELYVRYMEVWRDMCDKVTRDISVMEFVERVRDRPGVSDGEPWSEAKAYVGRMLDKVDSLAPRSVSEACAHVLRTVAANLACVPSDFEDRKRLLFGAIEDVRERLDSAGSHMWSWDSRMNDLYFDIRSDLAVLETLIGVGEISIKSLLYERSVLVSQLRKLVRSEGTLRLTLNQTSAKLAEANALRRRVERCGFDASPGCHP